jgi:hypothetical protein
LLVQIASRCVTACSSARRSPRRITRDRAVTQGIESKGCTMGQIGEVTEIREITVPDRSPEPLSPDAPDRTVESPDRVPAPAGPPAGSAR